MARSCGFMPAFVSMSTQVSLIGRSAFANSHLAASSRRRQRKPMPDVESGNRRGVSSLRMIRGFPNNYSGSSGVGDRRIFDELVDFPCVFTFKVIGERQGNFMNDIVDSVALALNTDKKNLKTSFRDRGKYRSITLKAPVNTGEQIYSVYAAIDRDPRVKFKF